MTIIQGHDLRMTIGGVEIPARGSVYEPIDKEPDGPALEPLRCSFECHVTVPIQEWPFLRGWPLRDRFMIASTTGQHIVLRAPWWRGFELSDDDGLGIHGDYVADCPTREAAEVAARLLGGHDCVDDVIWNVLARAVRE